jgi:hypothetical protein
MDRLTAVQRKSNCETAGNEAERREGPIRQSHRVSFIECNGTIRGQIGKANQNVTNRPDAEKSKSAPGG